MGCFLLIKEFAAPLMVGIIGGAYSSVCITGALWYTMKTFRKNRVAAPAAVAASAKISSEKSEKKVKTAIRTADSSAAEEEKP